MQPDTSTKPKKNLDGAEKAAALLLVMGKESAEKLASFFSPEELHKLSDAANRLKSLNIQTIDGLVNEFGKNYVSHGMFAGSEDFSDIFSVPSDTGKKPARPGSGQGASAEPEFPEQEELVEFLGSVPVHISAFLLGALEDEVAAKILTELESDKRNSIFKAYLDRNTLDPKVETLFKNSLFALILKMNEGDGTDEKIEDAAGIINYFSGDTGDELVDYIESNDPQAAAIIKKSLFKFSSVVDLEKEARSILFDGVETDDIVKALAEANDALKESVLEVLSQRNRRMVEAELARGTTKQEDMEASQRKIAGLTLSLSKEGKITLPGADA